MNVNATPCGSCRWWSDTPTMGADGRSWARCKMSGCLTDANFWCKHGNSGEVAPETCQSSAQRYGQN